MIQITSKIITSWMKVKEGILDAKDLEVEKYSGRNESLEGAWVCCPCRGDDHWGWWPITTTRGPYSWIHERAGVVTCFVTGKQWAIRNANSCVQDVIAGEERLYLALLLKAESIVKKVLKKRKPTEETVTFLYETHGVPKDISRDWFDTLVHDPEDRKLWKQFDTHEDES